MKLWTWIKNLFSRKPQRLGECVLGADSPEQAVTVSLTWLSGGRISAYRKGEAFDIHIYDAKETRHNGFYRMKFADHTPKDILDMTLDEFVKNFRVGDADG